jgi:very-short-patch-repair endonuclease
VVAIWQLLALGFSRSAIGRWVESGRLHRVHSGVYAVGHRRLGPRGWWMAAVLACGPGAVLSHQSAARLWGILGGHGSRTHVTVPARGRPRRAGIARHQVRRLDPQDRTKRDGIPLTSLARTLLDVAEVAPSQLDRAYEAAERLRLLDLAALHKLCERSPGRRGLKPLRALMADQARFAEDTNTGLEEQFAAFCRRHRLPPPAFNVLVEGYLVDAVWVDRRLVVELDSWSFHRTRAAFERDRVRDSALQLAGYRTIRITWRRLTSEPEAVGSTIRQLLTP